jgi:predicted Zn-dependent protease
MMCRVRPAAILAAIIAILACAWFALGIRQAHDTNAAQSILAGATSITPGQASRAQSLIEGAKALNPDKLVTLLQGRLYQLRHETARAARTYEQVTKDEPMNVEGWIALGGVAGSPQLALHALGEVALLAPPIKSKH